ncbi:N-acetyltransferase [Marmoricola endophyticus]|uniref:N-acetyltransferase n=1 Tax=Marmoricola endophyticus TaxID=2040280 RepID=A0A917BFV4_9ACTN|nr:GNAT family protein [Marmoricola endophyticus]GGF40345.1 N-acetyltransferase [Marmoricola endophyticus]
MDAREVAAGVRLAPLEPHHAEAFAAHMDRAREHIRPWVGPAFVSTDLVGARATLQRYADTAAHDGARLHGLWEDETLLGGVMYVSLDAAWGTCELGCWLEPAGEGRGLVTAGTRVLLDHAFDERGIHRAEWRCRSDNDRSVRVAQRLGMHLDGTLRGAWLFEGRHYDKQVWSLVGPEWAERRAGLPSGS